MNRFLLAPAYLPLALATLLAVPAASGQACDPEGAWEVVSLTLTDPDGTAREIEIDDPPGLKILSDTHWAFVDLTGDEEAPVSGGGGRYEVEGDTYTEFVTYHAAPQYIGTSIAFECETDGDTWRQSGMLPDSVYLEEVYRRAR